MPPRRGAGPKFVQLIPPLLKALQDLGGSAQPGEARDAVAAAIRLSDREAAETTKKGQPRFENKLHWARFYLSYAGLMDSTKRGVWTLSELGQRTSLTQAQALELFHAARAKMRELQKTEVEEEADEDADTPPEATRGHRSTAHELLMKLSPKGFERFSQRLLREAGFQDVEVIGRSGDGGIDGIGILQVNPLVSFKVLFQCKRYTGSVSPSQVRDFRGAMQGRADKGIIITTGTFTAEAKREAVRDGVPPIELMDGERLISMLEQLELGLRPVSAYAIDESFFKAFDAAR